MVKDEMERPGPFPGRKDFEADRTTDSNNRYSISREILTQRFNQIPEELRQLHRWVLFRLVNDKKIPINPRDLTLADCSNPATWGSFAQCVELFKGGEGDAIAFSLYPPFVGIDLDKCLEDGDLAAFARGLVEDIDSYTETSIRGQGVHITIKGHLAGAIKRKGFEVYQTGRFFIYTGDHYPGSPLEILERQAYLDTLPKARAHNDEAHNGAKITAGGRNNHLASLAGSMRRRGMSQAAIGAALLIENKERCDLPLNDEEVLLVAESISRYPPEEVPYQTKSGSEAYSQEGDDWPRLDPSDEAEALDSDRSNAVRLARSFGQQLLHVEHIGWHTWICTHWRRSDEEAVRIASQLSRIILEEAAGITEEASREEDVDRRDILGKRAEKLLRWAYKSESRSRVDAALWLARSLLNIYTEKLNRDLYALNVQNGVIDLHTGDVREHRRTDFITRCCPVAYDSEATAPKWEAFLRRIFADDVDVIKFVQRVAGYSLTGDIGEQCLFILYGSGANGKSVLLKVLSFVLGAYAHQAAPDLLLAKTRDNHPTEVADLLGARLVTAVETGEGRRLAESLVKQMTGGDRMKARFMRQDFFEFEATHKLWLATNHKPQIRGTDYAIWRRVRLIPFEVTIPEEEQEKGLADKLIAEEAPGILSWIVAGCLNWQEKGLAPPDKVTDATEAFRAEMDVLAGFLAECCEINHNPNKAHLYTTAAKELYEAYKQWCDRNGESPETQRSFGMRLTERGLEREKGKYGWSWKGIRVLPLGEGTV